MRIGFDVQSLENPERERGIGRFTYNLLHSLVGLIKEGETVLIGRECVPPSAVSALLREGRCRYHQLRLAYDCEEYLHYGPGAGFTDPELGHVDVLHLNSTLMPQTVIPGWAAVPISVLVHDLIPMVLKGEKGVEVLPEAIFRDYERRLELLKHYDLLLTNSESTRECVTRYLQIEPTRVACVGAGIEEHFFEPQGHDARRQPFILSVGGFSPSKNMEGHFRAFQQFLQLTGNANVKLVVVCRLQKDERKKWDALLKELGIERQVVVKGFVTGQELKTLYRQGMFLLFYSHYEGFGFPVGEAVASGMPVVASDIPTNRELLGEYEYLASPDDPGQCAQKMYALYQSLPHYHQELLPELHARISKYRWQQVAQRCIEHFRELVAPPIQLSSSTAKPRVALFTPLNPQRSGISDYIEELLPFLSKDFELVVFLSPAFEPEHRWVRRNLSCVPAYSFQKYRDRFDLVHYQFGNNLLHRYGYYLMRYHPGLVVMHDVNIGGLLQDLARLINPLELKWESEGCLEPAKAQQLMEKLIAQGWLDFSELSPCWRTLTMGARAIAVHNRWAAEWVHQHLPEKSVSTLPMGIQMPAWYEEGERKELKRRLGFPEEAFLVLSLGNITPFKRLNRAIQGFYWFQKVVPNSYYVIIGRFEHWILEKSYPQLLERLGLEKRVLFPGFLPAERVEEYLGAADVCINLRYPVMGETSATLLRALAAGLPCLITDHEQFSEFPEAGCLRIPIDYYEVDYIWDSLRLLQENRERHEEMRRRARQFITEHHTLERAAAAYAELMMELVDSSRVPGG